MLAGRWRACGSPGGQDLPRVHVCDQEGRAGHGGRGRNPGPEVHDDTWCAKLPAADGVTAGGGVRRGGGADNAECARGGEREAQHEGADAAYRTAVI